MDNLIFDYDLDCVHTNQASFYGNARVYRNKHDNHLVLVSYDTIVAEIFNNNSYVVYRWYSPTTAKHINEFLQQNGFAKMTKKEMEA